MNKNSYEENLIPHIKSENSVTSSGFEDLDRLRIDDQTSTSPLWQPDFGQDTADTHNPLDSNWDQSQFFLGNQPSQVFDGGSLTSFISEGLSSRLESSSDLSSDMDDSMNQNLHIEIVKIERSDEGSTPMEAYPGIKTNFLRSPIVRSKSAHETTSQPPITRPRSSTYPMSSSHTSASEILGQIILKHSVDGADDYMDIAPFVTFPQHEAARKLNLPSSTLSKKWKDATVNRKWPYRTLAKIDKEIATIMHNINRNSNGVVDKEAELQLVQLLQQRQAEMRPVIVRMN